MSRDKWQEKLRAIELIKLGYPENSGYLRYLLDFLSDMNWPGAREVLEYLTVLGEPIIEPVIEVLKGNDHYWQFNVIEYLLDSLPLELVIRVEEPLIQIAKLPLDKNPDDADLAALSLLARHKLWNTEDLKSILKIKSAGNNEYKLILEKLS